MRFTKSKKVSQRLDNRFQTVSLPFPFPNTSVWNHMYLEEQVFGNGRTSVWKGKQKTHCLETEKDVIFCFKSFIFIGVYFLFFRSKFQKKSKRVISSVGRAIRLQRKGQRFEPFITQESPLAGVVELADTPGLGPGALCHTGSSPVTRILTFLCKKTEGM